MWRWSYHPPSMSKCSDWLDTHKVAFWQTWTWGAHENVTMDWWNPTGLSLRPTDQIITLTLTWIRLQHYIAHDYSNQGGYIWLFLNIFLFFYLTACMGVGSDTQKILDGFAWNFMRGCLELYQECSCRNVYTIYTVYLWLFFIIYVMHLSSWST